MNIEPNKANERTFAEAKLKAARSNLLLMIILTVINLILLAFDSDVIMLFSASVPYFSVLIGKVSGIEVLLIGAICIAVISLVAYFLCWIFSKKHYAWMIVALVLFIIDSIFMVGMYITLGEISGVLDIAIHIMVLYYLIIGVKYGHRLKNLPETVIEGEATVVETTEATVNNFFEIENTDYSTPLKRADEDGKFRVLLESEYLGHHVCYRRVKRVNQLVVDDYVYAEIEMLVETAHELNARISGYTFQVGFDGMSHSYFKVDGEIVAKKLRLI